MAGCVPPSCPLPSHQLTADERHFLDTSTDTRRQFEAADRAIGEAAVWGAAGKQQAAAAAAGGVAVGPAWGRK